MKYEIRTRWFTIFREEAGVISPSTCWVIFHREYMYCHSTLLGVLWQLVTEFQNDRHLVG